MVLRDTYLARRIFECHFSTIFYLSFLHVVLVIHIHSKSIIMAIKWPEYCKFKFKYEFISIFFKLLCFNENGNIICQCKQMCILSHYRYLKSLSLISASINISQFINQRSRMRFSFKVQIMTCIKEAIGLTISENMEGQITSCYYYYTKYYRNTNYQLSLLNNIPLKTSYETSLTYDLKF